MAISAGTNSSFSSTIPPWKYHVFLSFKGEDTRTGFTDHLHTALQQRGIITFIDDELQRGKVISQQLIRAIQQSLISLVILSQNYASSSWCLDELQKILDSKKSLGREVIPVFYKIDPSDVRHQKGSIALAFQNHSERFSENKEKVQRWRDALQEAANISGYDSGDRHEGKLIAEIVAEVWTKLQPKLPYCLSNELVGIESRIAKVNSLLKIGSDEVHLIGIGGMSGIGKTTLARVIFERICGQFDISCFLADVKQNVETKGLVHLQRKLLSKLKIRGMEIDDEYEGKTMIRNLLYGKKLLIILDDVSEISQVENLSMKRDWLGSGSRIIVTTRNMQVLKEHGEFEMYNAELLNDNESLELFCKRAFKRDKPIEGYLKWCESVIHHAKGLPLTLEVLGSYFCGRNEIEWEGTLKEIEKHPPTSILKRLRVSYDALDDMKKKIFLDIACFFKGMKKEKATQIFEICGLYPILGIRELVEKCLITEYQCDNGTSHLGMHDILQEMGRSIVLEESLNDACKRSRLWSQEDIDHVMTRNKGSNSVEVIHLQSPMPYEANWEPEAFSMMCCLRILIVSCDVYLPRGLKCLPSSLRLLEWKSYPLKSLPCGAYLDQLVELKMRHSMVSQLWEGTPMAKKLKFIDLSYSEDLIRTPDFSMLPNLEELVLEGCIKLVEVHLSLGQHKKLVVLNMKDCKNLKALPIRMEMDSLNKLILSGCSKIKKLPEFGKNMNNLSVLDVKNCTNLVYLPRSTGNLKSLKILNILGCSKFSSLPENLDENKGLEELDLSGTAVREIPSSISGLQNLKTLSLNGCKGLGLTSNSSWNLLSGIRRVLGFGILEAPTGLVFPPFISSLASLKELDMSDCNLNVGSIPNDLGCLPSLEALDLSGNDFGNLPRGKWVLPPSFSRLSSLKSLNLSHCNLHDGSIPEDLNCLSSLERLGLLGNKFTHLPAGCVSNLPHLYALHLSHCPALKFLPDLPPNLKQIDTIACHSMHPLSFPKLLSKFVTSTNDFHASFSSGTSNRMDFKIWWLMRSEIPSWFIDQNYQYLNKVDGFQDDHVVEISEQEFFCRGSAHIEKDNFVPSDSIVSIKLDISHLWDSSERWGVSLCLVLQDPDLPVSSGDVFHRSLLWTCKASQDKFYKNETFWHIEMGNYPHQMLMVYLPSHNFTVDSDQIEIIFYTQKYKCIAREEALGVEVDLRGKFIIKNCGWRVTCKKDVEEWLKIMNRCSTNGDKEIPSQNSLYDIGKRCHESEEAGEEVISMVDEETKTCFAKRRKLE